MNPSPKAILAFRDLAANTSEMQRLALFFDHIFLWMPIPNNELSQHDQTHMYNEIEFLRSEGIVATMGEQIPSQILDSMPSFLIGDGSEEVDVGKIIGQEQQGYDISVPFTMKKPGAPEISEEMRKWELLRKHARNIKIRNDLSSTPVSVYYDASQIQQADSANSQALLITIDNFVMPPENIPWKDLLQFRADDENQKLLRRFRRWFQDISTAEESSSFIAEKLQHQLDEYKNYMSVQHKKHSLAKLKISMTMAPAVFTGNIIAAAAALITAGVTLKQKRITLEEVELSAPGREISYLVKAQNYTQ